MARLLRILVLQTRQADQSVGHQILGQSAALAETPTGETVRRELKKAGIAGVKAVYSEDTPLLPDRKDAKEGEKFIGSVSFVTGAAGLLVAGEIVRDILSSDVC